jgi:hypothetical protein
MADISIVNGLLETNITDMAQLVNRLGCYPQDWPGGIYPLVN